MSQENFELNYLKLKDKVRKMLAAQDSYFKTKDPRQLFIAKNYRKQVLEILDPPEKVKTLFDLGA